LFLSRKTSSPVARKPFFRCLAEVSRIRKGLSNGRHESKGDAKTGSPCMREQTAGVGLKGRRDSLDFCAVDDESRWLVGRERHNHIAES